MQVSLGDFCKQGLRCIKHSPITGDSEYPRVKVEVSMSFIG